MSTVYIDGMAPIEVPPNIAQAFAQLAVYYDVGKDTLDDLIANRPGGVVRVRLGAKRYK